MRIRNSLSALVLGLGALAPTAALATGKHHGITCHGTTPEEAAKLERSQYGVFNKASTPAKIQCAGEKQAGVNAGEIAATWWDQSNTQDLFCTVKVTDNGGHTLFTTFLNSDNFAQAAKTKSASLTPLAGLLHMACSLPATAAYGPSYLSSYTIK